ncbi:MAG: ROK family protein [Synergistaceae bacterium]|nr:ROK family protein [Synergistaceae bacterium]
MEYYIGVDIGGTNLKAGIVNSYGEIIGEADIPTGAERPQEIVLQDIFKVVREAIKNSGVNQNDIKAAGLGSPGMIDSKNGIVIRNYNLGWKDFEIAKLMSKEFNIPVTLENDADAAALGEVISGSAKGADSAMIITLGTGVGSGFVINEKIFRGCEWGHMVIVKDGKKCTCGRNGCFESYCSATGLINMTKEKISEFPNGILAETAKSEGKITGRTVFDAADKGDENAKILIDEYLNYLACGLVNLINGLQPEVVSIGGGIAKQGEKLLSPLREKVKAEVFGGIKMPKIVTCTLGYKAGLIGAAMAAKNL